MIKAELLNKERDAKLPDALALEARPMLKSLDSPSHESRRLYVSSRFLA